MLATIVAATIVTLSAPWVAAVGGIVIPFLTGLITKAGAPAGVKGIVTLVLVAVLTVATAVVRGNGVLDTGTVTDALLTLLISVLWLFNVHLPFDLDRIGLLVPSKGIGKDPEIGGI